MKNLHELPKFADKLSYLYVEHAVIDQHEKAIAIHDAEGVTPVPAASLAVLILGPGTSLTHAAVKAMSDNNCQIIWSGEHGVRFYAQGLGGSRHSRNLLHQARLLCNEITRLQVVIRMYCIRFSEPIDPNLNLRQLRGKEGIRVRQAYAEASQQYGVPWQGRSYKRDTWNMADPVNRALSAANSCLYGLTHAAILSGGYSAALGFIHSGEQLSFVYDVADLYKADFTIPVAFAMAAAGGGDIERRVRIACRDAFRKARLMERILPDIAKCLDLPEAVAEQTDDFADDGARPADLWEPDTTSADAPIGRVLSVEALRASTQVWEKTDDRHDTGTSEPLPAG